MHAHQVSLWSDVWVKMMIAKEAKWKLKMTME